MNYKLSILVPTHQRAGHLEKTLIKLDKLKDDNEILTIIILDGCKKVSYDLLKKYKRKNLTYLEGDGSLYWGGAMALGMQTAFEKYKRDAVLWLNDDARFTEEDIIEIKRLSTIYKNAVLSGNLYAFNIKDYYIYELLSAFDKKNNLFNAKSVNGNFTLIPHSVYKFIGNIDPDRSPHFADSPYLVKAQQNNFPIVVAKHLKIGNYYDVLRHLPLYMQYALGNKTLFKFINEKLFDIKSKWYLKYRFYNVLTRYGSKGYIYYFLIYARDFFPILLFAPLKYSQQKEKIIIKILKNWYQKEDKIIKQLKKELDN